MKRLESPSEGITLAGERYRTHARSTGALVVVVDANEWELDPCGPWTTFCDTHGNLVTHDTLRTAKYFAAAPEEWCDDCRQLALSPG